MICWKLALGTRQAERAALVDAEVAAELIRAREPAVAIFVRARVRALAYCGPRKEARRSISEDASVETFTADGGARRPVWVRMCERRWSERVKARRQMWQMKGFGSQCVFMCRWKEAMGSSYAFA